MSDDMKRPDNLGGSDEPENPWTTLASEQPYVTQWLAIHRDTVRTHTGAEITYCIWSGPTVWPSSR